MLLLSSAPCKIEGIEATHLVHFNDMKAPMVKQAMAMIQSKTTNTIMVGETLISDGGFRKFDLVVLHTVSDPNWANMMRRLKNHVYVKRFQEIITDPNRTLYVYGSSVQMLPTQITRVPHGQDALKRSLIDTNSKGLGILPFRIDINFDPQRAYSDDKFYTREIRLLSKQNPIYLLDGAVLYSYSGTARFGSVYLAKNGSITVVKELPRDMKQKDRDQVAERQMPNMELLYEDKDKLTEEEKAQVEGAVAKRDTLQPNKQITPNKQ